MSERELGIGLWRGMVVLVVVVVASLTVWFAWPKPEPPMPEPAPARVGEEAESDPAASPSRTEVDQPEAPAAAPGVQGVVYGPTGEPEPGVRIELRRVTSPWPDLRSERLEAVLTGPEGRFLMRTPRGRDLLVVANKSRLARTEVSVSPLDPDIVVRMAYGFDLEGIVQDPRREPLSNCVVVLEPTAASAERALQTRTDRAGRFAFRDVRAGALRVTARHPDYRPVSEPVALGARPVVQLRFSGRRPFALNGTVSTASEGGAPLEGVVVRGYPNAWNGRLFLPFEAVTNARGEFTVPGLEGGNLALEFRHPDYSTRRRLIAVSAESEPLDVELVSRSWVSGRLVGRQTVAGELQLSQPGESPMRCRVESDGRFSFEQPASTGKAELRLLNDEHCFQQSGARTVQVDVRDAEQTELDLELADASVTTGRVVDSEGRGLPGVRVLWRQPSDGLLAPPALLDVTDPDGSYEVRGLPRAFVLPGILTTSRFVFERYGYARVERPFPGAAPGSLVELETVVLARPGAITGRVVRRGLGVAGAVVFTGNVMNSMQTAVTGPDGAFVLRELPPGVYRLKVAYSTRPLWLSDETFVVEADRRVDGVELDLPSGRMIEGSIVDPYGTPVPGALVVVRGSRGAAHNGDANGQFRIEVPREDVELEVFANVALHDLHVRTTVDVPQEQGRVRVELPMVRTGTIVGRILGQPDRRPLAGAILRVTSLDAPAGVPAVDRQRNITARWVEMVGGELRLEQFPAGRSRVTVHCEGYKPYTTVVDVSPDGAPMRLGEVLLERGARVRGVVVDTAGNPIAGARVHLGQEVDRVPPAAMGGAGFTDAEGRFALWGVGSTSHDLVVSARGFATCVHALELPADLLRADALRISLDHGSSIEAVVGDVGAAPGEFQLVFLEKAGELVDFVGTDERGVARFDHLGPGVYELAVLGGERKHTVEIGAEPNTYKLRLEIEGG